MAGLKHIAFIMDGNGRWAQERGKPRTDGHKMGARALERAVSH
ncbi:MAG: undecaprenyl diphosphate synthase family protein, partial [Clostridia bacterium]|nr:undecaprenyl diphosphate synthase family protein [Clostridia bacterium]